MTPGVVLTVLYRMVISIIEYQGLIRGLTVTVYILCISVQIFHFKLTDKNNTKETKMDDNDGFKMRTHTQKKMMRPG